MAKNNMRHEEFLQNYKPAQLRSGLSGKLNLADTILPEGATSRDWWIQIFTEAIEDLEAGNFVNGKPIKSRAEYWEEQIELAKTFTPKQSQDRSEYLRNYMKSNYSQIRIVIRKDDPVDQEIVRYLNRKPDKSGFLKQMILQEIERERKEEQTMTVHDKRTDVYHRDFSELIELEKSVYTERDALELLDRLDTSRETTYRLPNGIGTWDWRDFIDPSTLKQGDELILTGEQHCGNKYKLIEIVHLAEYDEESEEFMEEWTEPIGWDNY